MNTLTRLLAIGLTCTLLFAGCDSLNLQPPDEIGEEQVWQDPGLTQAYLNGVYPGIGHGLTSPKKASMTNDAVHTHGWGTPPLTTATITPDNMGAFGPGARPSGSSATGRGGPWVRFRWNRAYSNIRDLNIFLREFGASNTTDPDTKEMLLGEAYFLRAYFYTALLRAYGGVPLLSNVFELEGDLEQYQIPRNTFAETVEFIIADLDSAATRLSVEGRRQGTASRGAALAVKCRVRLHAASDLYAQNPSGMPETGYTEGSQQDRWQAAKEACQAVIDMNEYSLEQADTPEAYHALFAEGTNESGTIFARYFSEQGDFDPRYPRLVNPNGYQGWTGDSPTQQHVDAYEMMDGSEFEWEAADPVSADEPVDAEDPYANRDPRLYANVLYNGAEWQSRPSGLASLDPRGVIQTGWYEMPNEEGLRAGLDTRDGPIQPWNGTWTGYNLKKFLDIDIAAVEENVYTTPWPHLRYAEVLLNYAEASAELGHTQDALRTLNMVRSRAGMPDVPANGGPNRTLMERIRQERRVELAFEGFRFFDIRRWMIAPEILDNDAQGVRIVGRLVDESDPEAQLLSTNYYDYEYNVRGVNERLWEPKLYFLPIPAEEMLRNPQLVQNPNY